MAKTILSVDDSASVRQMVKLTLSGAGYDILEACDGKDALAKAGSAEIHMVVTDLNMPNMDGLSLIKELRKLPAYKGVPIVFLTTESDEGKKAEAKQSGATAWITKPFKQEQLLAIVKKVLG
ncbi:response regulator receiver domain-containing protein [Paramagnetospirillum caucaseum]|uniref:Response regulator receiver domain-containing protein n=1 Tax=Paramagnetospirillum caucaseum TaxID=1244869 RepID=M3A9W3_9PROT|nr:response regulator [Paramagnetospirillum caucaseum]EME69558.1 response regulator receiver domain-containing protein [Paramagnetospirillum caucaseum]